MGVREKERFLELKAFRKRDGLIAEKAERNLRRIGFCPPVPHHDRAALRGLLPALREGLRHGTHQPPLQRVDRGLRLGTAHRSAAGPAHSPRPHPGDERRELPAQVQPGERPAPSSRRSRRRINRTLDAFSSCSCNVAALPDLLPSVTSQRVHFCSALLAPHPGALDTSARIRGLSARGRAFSALGGQEAKRS